MLTFIFHLLFLQEFSSSFRRLTKLRRQNKPLGCCTISKQVLCEQTYSTLVIWKKAFVPINDSVHHVVQRRMVVWRLRNQRLWLPFLQQLIFLLSETQTIRISHLNHCDGTGTIYGFNCCAPKSLSETFQAFVNRIVCVDCVMHPKCSQTLKIIVTTRAHHQIEKKTRFHTGSVTQATRPKGPNPLATQHRWKIAKEKFDCVVGPLITLRSNFKGLFPLHLSFSRFSYLLS